MTNPIKETIVCTQNDDGTTHITPLGVHVVGKDKLLILPFRPSRSLENLERTGEAVVNYTDDVRVFAGCLTGRRNWDLMPCEILPVQRLSNALAHAEVRVTEIHEDDIRPGYTCTVICERTHRPFRGFSRAQAAIIELAILTSRLNRLPFDEIAEALDRLRIPLEKTAGEDEKTAWRWLCEKIKQHNELNNPTI